MHQSMPDSLPIAAQYREGDVTLVNAILRRCIGERVRGEFAELTLVKCQHLNSLPAPTLVQLDLKVGTEALAVRMSQHTLELLLGPVCWAALDPAMQRLFVADQLSQTFAQWTRTFDLTVTVEAINPIPGPVDNSQTATIALDLQTHQKQTGQILLLASERLNKRVAAAIENSSLPLQQFATTLRCNLIAGYQQLNEDDLHRLCAGAVILANNRLGQAIPAPSPAASITVEVTLIDHPFCLAKAETGRIRVIASDALLTAHETAPAMNDIARPTTAPDTSENTNLPLTFRLGKAHIAMNDLQAVSPGHVFNASIDPTEPKVEICLGDECVGHGRLVSVGDQLGVEVTAWGTSNE